ncbi:MAG: hypothetical protein K2X09_03520, partial [Rickettsiales bacterium]|nr:hypothetical protein [Rickettsiales bacterium]
MRKQYHFRPSLNGLLAWDIHRLITLSEHFPVIEVALRDIRELDEAYWSSDSSVLPTCRTIVEHVKLIEQADLQFPIILFSDGRVGDGMHRVCRALKDGAQIIKAVQFAEDPMP